MAKKGGGLPRHITTGKTSGASQPTGSNIIKLPTDGGTRSVAKGIEGLRHSVTKPNNQGATKLAGAPKDQKNTTLGRVYIRTKPNK